VLALSAPTSAQFLGNEMMLARFDRDAPSIEERAAVRMASAETGPVVEEAASEAAVVQASVPTNVAPRPAAPLAAPQLVRKASLELPTGSVPGASSATLRAPKPLETFRRDRSAATPAPPKSAPPKPLLRSAAGSDASATRPSAQVPVRDKPAAPASAKPVRDKPIVLASAKSAILKAPTFKPGAVSASGRSAEKPKSGGRIGDSLAREIGAAAKAEARSGGR
jgi:hypothetical protein